MNQYKSLEQLTPNTDIQLPITIFQNKPSKFDLQLQAFLGYFSLIVALGFLYPIGSLMFKVTNSWSTAIFVSLFNPFMLVLVWLAFHVLKDSKKAFKRFAQLPKQFIFAQITTEKVSVYSYINELVFDHNFESLEFCKSNVFKGTHIFEIKAKNAKKVGFGITNFLYLIHNGEIYRIKGYDVAYLINLAKETSHNRSSYSLKFNKALYINAY